MHPPPTFAEEETLHRQGYRFIAGIDEVGRGSLAGPVVAGAVILPLEANLAWLNMVRDSKQLTPLRRDFLFDRIGEAAVATGIGMVSPDLIDTRGIITATRLAMTSAIEQLSRSPDFLLIDAIRLPDLDLPQKSIVGGDSSSFSIAAASIVAKVTRDRLMIEMDSLYPGYGFAQHKGYATRMHLLNLWRLGASPIHRKSFSPVRKVLATMSRSG